jgi:hypothetical protein
MFFKSALRGILLVVSLIALGTSPTRYSVARPSPSCSPTRTDRKDARKRLTQILSRLAEVRGVVLLPAYLL